MEELFVARVPRSDERRGLAPRAVRNVKGSLQFSVGSTLLDVHFHIGAGQDVVQYLSALWRAERFPDHLFDVVLSALTALLEHEHGPELSVAMRSGDALRRGIEMFCAAERRRGPTALEQFSAAHAFLACVIREGFPLLVRDCTILLTSPVPLLCRCAPGRAGEVLLFRSRGVRARPRYSDEDTAGLT